MTDDAVTLLLARAEIAKRLADEIRLLRAADPERTPHKLTCYAVEGGMSVLPGTLLEHVFEVGRIEFLTAKEKELEALVAPEVVSLEGKKPELPPGLEKNLGPVCLVKKEDVPAEE